MRKRPGWQTECAIALLFAILISACSGEVEVTVTPKVGVPTKLTASISGSVSGISGSGAAKFGLNDDGSMTVQIKDEDGNWESPKPLSEDLDSRYQELLGRRPVAGESIEWEMASGDPWALEVPASTTFVSGNITIGGVNYSLVRDPDAEAYFAPRSGYTVICLTPSSLPFSSGSYSATFQVELESDSDEYDLWGDVRWIAYVWGESTSVGGDFFLLPLLPLGENRFDSLDATTVHVLSMTDSGTSWSGGFSFSFP